LINCENFRGETPLHIAARAGKAGAVELLLPQGVPTYPDRFGNSALHEAVRNRHHEVINHLVNKDPSLLYCQNKESKSPLCIAVETGDLKVLELLLEALNDSEDWRRSKFQKIFGMSPVHVALIHSEMGKPCFCALVYSLIFSVTLVFFILISTGGGKIKYHKQSLD